MEKTGDLCNNFLREVKKGMVVQSATKDLREEFNDLLNFCEKANIKCDYDNELFSEENGDINEDWEFGVFLPETEEYEYHPLWLILDMVTGAKNAKKVNNRILISGDMALYRIDSNNYLEVFSHLSDIPGVTEIVDGNEYNIEISEGLTSYGFAIAMRGEYNDVFPPVDFDDSFIEITCCNGEIDESIIESLVQAYIFEIKSTLGIEIQINPRQYAETIEKAELNSRSGLISRLRPLLRGKGIDDVLKLYNSSLSTENEEFLILTYTKVIEYVSQTVIQEDLISLVSKKLSSPKALIPDAAYILELDQVFEKNRNNKKEHLAIRLTLQTCCDIMEIVSFAPSFLKNTKKLIQNNSEENKQRAIEEVSAAINQTRNMFAHAKTNYEKKGNECPDNQLGEFSKCMDILAQQVIRWFAREHENNRVV